jgi:methionyl-tRNA formyltransferase
MKAVVFAYHNLGIAGLEALLRAGDEIQCVFSHEDDPRENCWFGSVKAWAEQYGIPVHCPPDLKDPAWEKRIAALQPDIIYSFYYRHLLANAILKIPAKGAYNLHGSLLPDYRGRCPVNWVLINGETRTGVTLHHMVARADAGDIVGQRAVTIARDDTALKLYGKLCDAAAALLDEMLPLIETGRAPRRPQDVAKGSYYGGRRPEDGRIDWRFPAEKIYNLIRAVTEPYPGAYCLLPDGSRLMIWWAVPERRSGSGRKGPGEIAIEGAQVLVQAGEGSLRLLDVAGSNTRMTGHTIVPYFKTKEGMILT